MRTIGLLCAAIVVALGLASSAAAVDSTLAVDRKATLGAAGSVEVVLTYDCAGWTSAALSVAVEQRRGGTIVNGDTVSTDVVCDGVEHTVTVEVFGTGAGAQPAAFRHGKADVDAVLLGCAEVCGPSVPVAADIRISG
jgi:hypothetical protein